MIRPAPSAVFAFVTNAHVRTLRADARHQQRHVADDRANCSGHVAPTINAQLPWQRYFDDCRRILAELQDMQEIAMARMRCPAVSCR